MTANPRTFLLFLVALDLLLQSLDLGPPQDGRA